MTAAPTGLSTVTAKRSVPSALAGRSGTSRVQVVPGGLRLAHDQEGLLLPALNRVWSGTVSVMTTAVAGPDPTLP